MHETSSRNLAANSAEVKVLLVDDEPTILRMLGEWLGFLGYACATATDGLEAVEALKKEAFGIVITDINMPRMGGLELLGYIRKFLPRTEVIVLTGQTASYGSDEVLELGAAYFLAKPFLVTELKTALTRVGEHRSRMRQLQLNGSRPVLDRGHAAAEELRS